MKRIQLILLILILSYSGIQAQSGGKIRYLKPTNFTKKVTHLISGKSRKYYSLSTEKSSIINVRGPGKIRVISRGRFVPEEKESIDYEILYTINGGEQKSIKESDIKRSTKSTYLNGSLGVPSQNRDFEIELGRGYHSLEFKLKSEQIPVAVKYNFTLVKAKKIEWVAFSPKQPSEPVDLIASEKIVNYYRFSMEKPLKVEVNGPTQLRVLTRLENHYHMKGRIHYRVQVKEKDKILNTYQLSSVRSDIAVYKDDTDLVPGKAREFVILVPKGRHSYEIMPLDKDKSTVLGRLLLPEKDVKLEE